jgi:hypothetical protein
VDYPRSGRFLLRPANVALASTFLHSQCVRVRSIRRGSGFGPLPVLACVVARKLCRVFRKAGTRYHLQFTIKFDRPLKSPEIVRKGR